MRIEVGSYIGNATDNRNIVLSDAFQPDFVIIMRDIATAPQPVFRTAGNSGDQSFRMVGASFAADVIQAFNTDGFQIGADTFANANNDIYAYLAIQEDASNTMDANAFTSDNTDSRNIVISPSFQPTFTFVKTNSTTAGVFRHSTHSGDTSSYFQATANAADNIQAFNADGFQVGLTQNPVGSILVAFAAFIAQTGICAVGSYTGNGSTQSISGLGFTPQCVFIKNNTTTAQSGVIGFTTATSGRSFLFDGGDAITNGITSFDSDGFSIGANARTNTNTETYMYIAWGAVIRGLSGLQSKYWG